MFLKTLRLKKLPQNIGTLVIGKPSSGFGASETIGPKTGTGGEIK